ncbi:MAG: hypothetical protein RL091_1952, partial [Verrucomicrobiota bacterium]
AFRAALCWRRFLDMLDSSYLVYGDRPPLSNFRGPLQIFGMANTVTRDVTVTMPNGEILAGKFTEQENSTSRSGKAYALLKSATSNLLLEITVSYNEYGNGFGEARANNGKNYKIEF